MIQLNAMKHISLASIIVMGASFYFSPFSLCFADPSDDEGSPSSPNLVIRPDFDAHPTDGVSPSPEKLQYAPVTDELPPLQKKSAPTEQTNGASYSEGEDLYYSQKPGFVVQTEKIDEPKEEGSEETPAPTHSP